MRSLTISDPALVARSRSAPPTPASPAEVWWAGDLALADTDPVASWVGRINGVTVAQGTSGNRPAFDIDGVGGCPSVAFDGTTDFLRHVGTLSTSLSGCVIAVISGAAASAQEVWASGDEASTTRYVEGQLSSTPRAVISQRNNDTNDVVTATTTTISSAAHIVEWASSGTAYSLRVDNAVQSLTVSGGSNTGDWFGDTSARDNFTIGALVRTTTILYFGGRVAYLGVFDAPLADGDRGDLYAWLGAHYGIAV